MKISVPTPVEIKVKAFLDLNQKKTAKKTQKMHFLTVFEHMSDSLTAI